MKITTSVNNTVQVTTKEKPDFTLTESSTHYVLMANQNELSRYHKSYGKEEAVARANNFLSSWGYSLTVK